MIRNGLIPRINQFNQLQQRLPLNFPVPQLQRRNEISWCCGWTGWSAIAQSVRAGIRRGAVQIYGFELAKDCTLLNFTFEQFFPNRAINVYVIINIGTMTTKPLLVSFGNCSKHTSAVPLAFNGLAVLLLGLPALWISNSLGVVRILSKGSPIIGKWGLVGDVGAVGILLTVGGVGVGLTVPPPFFLRPSDI